MTLPRAGIILQARFASMRLPGKALARIGSRSVLERCLRRLMAGDAGEVVLATTTKAEDDALVEVARDLGAAVFRGDEADVLGRYVAAAGRFGFGVVVRATGDNPAVDVEAPGRVLAALRASGADYACEDGLPYGAAVEAVTAAALARAAAEAHDPADREHVTTYIKRNPAAFAIARVGAPARLRRPGLRVTLDTPDDLVWLRSLFGGTFSEEPSLRELIECADRAVRLEASCL